MGARGEGFEYTGTTYEMSRVGHNVLSIILAIFASLGAITFSGQAYSNPKYAAYVMDANTGKVLYARNATARRYPASLTKIMTLYVLFDYLEANRLDYNTKFYVTPNATVQPPSKLGLKPGTYVKVHHLIKALVTKSANDAAAVIAENLAGTEANFAAMMTRKARKLGMWKTTFRNASGLPNRQQTTTAKDMAILSKRVMEDYPQYAKFFKTRYFRYKGRRYRNHNSLLFNYAGTEGIKTGYTRASGFNLTTSVRKGNKHIIAVVMGGKTGRRRDAHMRALLNRYFSKAVAMRKKPRKRRLTKVAVPVRKTPEIRTTNSTQHSAPMLLGSTVEQGSTDATPTAQRPACPKGFDIQVGAYASQKDAETRLSAAKNAAGDLLKDHAPFTIQFKKDEQLYYRARFSNFTKSEARAACAALDGSKISCLPMRAQ